MADDKRADNGKRDDDKRHDDRRTDEKRSEKSAAASEDLTPVPTQAQLDELAGGKDRKVEPRKAPEVLPPTPTQAEADETKAKLYGVEVPKKREVKDVPEAVPPTPTQAENDQAKLAAMYVPEGAGDPQKAESQTHRRQVEANRPGGYETRSASAKAE